MKNARKLEYSAFPWKRALFNRKPLCRIHVEARLFWCVPVCTVLNFQFRIVYALLLLTHFEFWTYRKALFPYRKGKHFFKDFFPKSNMSLFVCILSSVTKITESVCTRAEYVCNGNRKEVVKSRLCEEMCVIPVIFFGKQKDENRHFLIMGC